jgi:hypothetical protein
VAICGLYLRMWNRQEGDLASSTSLHSAGTTAVAMGLYMLKGYLLAGEIRREKPQKIYKDDSRDYLRQDARAGKVTIPVSGDEI